MVPSVFNQNSKVPTHFSSAIKIMFKLATTLKNVSAVYRVNNNKTKTTFLDVVLMFLLLTLD